MQKPDIETNAPPVRIRAAHRRDGPSLIRMVAALAAFNGDISTVTPGALERDLFGATACASALLALRADRAVGYAVLFSRPQLHFGVRQMALHHLFVEPEHRGAGVGRYLVAAAVAEARRQQCGRLAVATHEGNARAQAIYRSLGFTPQPQRGPCFALELPADGTLPDGWV